VDGNETGTSRQCFMKANGDGDLPKRVDAAGARRSRNLNLSPSTAVLPSLDKMLPSFLELDDLAAIHLLLNGLGGS
jgi:hypothetical protein